MECIWRPYFDSNTFLSTIISISTPEELKLPLDLKRRRLGLIWQWHLYNFTLFKIYIKQIFEGGLMIHWRWKRTIDYQLFTLSWEWEINRMTNQYGMARIHPSPHIGTIDEDMTQKSEELQTMDRVCERLQRIKSLSLIVWKGL